jgi:hypothetical protein
VDFVYESFLCFIAAASGIQEPAVRNGGGR